MTKSQETVISVKGVDKTFRLPHERTTTVKSFFINLAKGAGSKYYETQQALKDISFEVNKGEFFGIVGRNGSGKSTLLKILAGIYQPSSGSVETKGKLIPFIELGVGFDPELTGRENVYLNGAMFGFSKDEMDERYQEIVDFAELEEFMDQKLKNYSSGMQVRLAFSVAVQADADILLIDEVLAVGDADFQKKCYKYFKKLKKENKTVVFVSHDMQAVQEYCDRGIFINDSEVVTAGDTFEISKAYSLENTKSSRKEVPNKRDNASKKDSIFVQKCYSTDRRGELKNNYYADDKNVEIQFEITSRSKVDSPVLGVVIMDSEERPVVAVNTKDLKKELGSFDKGTTKKIHLSIQNIFNDGDYTVQTNIRGAESKAAYSMQRELCAFSVAGRKNTYSLTHPYIDFEIGQ